MSKADGLGLLPPPLWGRVGEGGDAGASDGASFSGPPPPIPPHKGEGSAPRLVFRWKASRFSEARLQAVSSRNMYSEHGLEARIGPDAGQVCQSLTVVWYCKPGSAEAQAA